jgi:hypothetical protein
MDIGFQGGASIHGFLMTFKEDRHNIYLHTKTRRYVLHSNYKIFYVKIIRYFGFSINIAFYFISRHSVYLNI